MNSEKVSVNINNDKLSKIDLLVEEGLVNNRSTFINDAIDLLLSKNQKSIDKIIEQKQATLSPNQWFIGIQSVNKEYLINFKNGGVKISLSGFGSLYMSKDIDVELINASIDSISKKIRVHCTNEQFEALKDKIK